MGASVSPVEQICKNYQSLSCDSLPYNVSIYQNPKWVGCRIIYIQTWQIEKSHLKLACSSTMNVPLLVSEKVKLIYVKGKMDFSNDNIWIFFVCIFFFCSSMDKPSFYNLNHSFMWVFSKVKVVFALPKKQEVTIVQSLEAQWGSWHGVCQCITLVIWHYSFF